MLHQTRRVAVSHLGHDKSARVWKRKAAISPTIQSDGTMKTACRILISCVLTFSSLSASAVVINGLDWLQLTTTQGYSAAQLDAIFDRSTGACDVAGCLLGGSIDLTGYTWASAATVEAMLASVMGGTLSTVAYPISVAGTPAGSADPLFAQLSPTHIFSGTELLRGLFRDPTPLPYGAGFIDVQRAVAPNDTNADLRIYYPQQTYNLSNPYAGAWLYTSPPAPVPLPAAAWLFGTAIAGLGFARKYKQRALAA